MRNVIGRENLITCGRTNELAHAVRTEYSCDRFMDDRMGLNGTMLHYLAVRKAMASLHKPVHSKITLTYSLTWQTEYCTSRSLASQPYFSVGGARGRKIRLDTLASFSWPSALMHEVQIWLVRSKLST